VGDVAPNAAWRLVGQPKCHLGPALPRVPQPDSAPQADAGDANPRQVTQVVELDHLDQTANRHRADLPMNGIAGADADWLVVGAFPPLQAGHEGRIAVWIADDFPDRIAVGIDYAAPFDSHQPSTGNRRR